MPQLHLATTAYTLRHYHRLRKYKLNASSYLLQPTPLFLASPPHPAAATTTKALLPFLFLQLKFLVFGVENLQCHIVPYLTYFNKTTLKIW